MSLFAHQNMHLKRYLVYLLLKYSYRCYIFYTGLQQYELIFRYHFLFCVLLNRNTSYRSFSGILILISKVKGEARLRRFVLLRRRKAEQEVCSHSAVMNPSLYRFLRFLYYKYCLFAFKLSEDVSP